MKSEMQIVKEYSSSVPVDVEGLIEALGILYIEEPMPAESSGRIDCNDPFFTITINSDEGPQRRRFTAAHELGHYLLHRDMIDGKGHLDRLFSNQGGSNPLEPFQPTHEVQANQFAAQLLMPASSLRRDYNGETDNVLDLAAKYHVSPAALRIRLKALGLRRR